MIYTVKIHDTGIPGGVKAIAEALPEIAKLKTDDTVKFHFEQDFLYLTGLVLLAAWRKHLPSGVHVRVEDNWCSEPKRKLITNTGFREIAETGHEYASVQRRLGRIPLQPITNRFNKEATVKEITSIFEEHAGHINDTEPFKVLLSELCENVLAHSESTSPGYVCARVIESDHRDKVEIAIADTGIGILESFLQGTNPHARERIKNGALSIDIAVEGLASSKPRAKPGDLYSYYGYGLFITRRLVEENRGQLTIMSGTELLKINWNESIHQTLAQEWHGTFVGIVLDLANPLPLEEIYEEGTSLLVPQTQTSTEEKSGKALDKPLSITRAHEAKDVDDTGIVNVQLRHYGTELLTREAGIAIRAEVASYLAGHKNVQVLLDGISDITPSVADEAFGKLAEIIGFDQFSERVKFIKGTSVIYRLIDFVIKTRARSQRMD